MTIGIHAPEVYALAEVLRGEAGSADEVEAQLSGVPEVGSSLQSAVEEFLACHRTAARALAGELLWLGYTVAAVADSWIRLDAVLVAPVGEARVE